MKLTIKGLTKNYGPVEDRGFGGVDVYDGVVHAQRPERRHDVFDGRDAVAAGFDGRAARGVHDMVAQGGDYGLSLDVGAAEYDAGAGIGGIDGHGYFHARMKALSRERNRSLQRLLFGRHKRSFLYISRKDNTSRAQYQIYSGLPGRSLFWIKILKFR